MPPVKTFFTALATAAGALALTAPASPAIVGGTNAAAGEFPSVAYVTFGSGFQCTGTLIAPNWVLTAGHCGSLTGAAVGTPAAWPAPLINVRVNSINPGQGQRLTVQRAVVHPNYLFSSGYDITLLQTTAAIGVTPTKIAGAAERNIWDPGDLETIVGYGATSEGGSSASVLQKAQVPITTDAYCGGAYSDFDAATMVCAGFPEGGIDTCQGDSGGPMFGRTGTGVLRVVGATSFGEGCARPERPGVYARVADTTLRNWIASNAPAGVA